MKDYQDCLLCLKVSEISAGADLVQFVSISTSDAHRMQFLADLKIAFASSGKPLLSAVVGFADIADSN